MAAALPSYGTDCCSQTCDTLNVLVPGAPGTAGAAGEDGADGVSSFTYLAASFVMPAVNANVTSQFLNSSSFSPGQNIYVQNAGYFQFISSTSSTNGVIKNLGYTGNVVAGTVVAASNKVSPAGLTGGSTPGIGTNHSGSGSPEGVKTGSVGDRYWDTTNKIDYVKDTGDATTTGWQELTAVPV